MNHTKKLTQILSGKLYYFENSEYNCGYNTAMKELIRLIRRIEDLNITTKEYHWILSRINEMLLPLVKNDFDKGFNSALIDAKKAIKEYSDIQSYDKFIEIQVANLPDEIYEFIIRQKVDPHENIFDELTELAEHNPEHHVCKWVFHSSKNTNDYAFAWMLHHNKGMISQ